MTTSADKIPKLIKTVAKATVLISMLASCGKQELPAPLSIEQKALDFFCDSLVYHNIFDTTNLPGNIVPRIVPYGLEPEWTHEAMFKEYVLVTDGIASGLTAPADEKWLQIDWDDYDESIRHELKGYNEYAEAHREDTTTVKLEIPAPIKYCDIKALDLARVYPYLEAGPCTLFVEVSKKIVSHKTQMVDIEIERWRENERQSIKFTITFDLEGRLIYWYVQTAFVHGDV